MDIVIDDCKIHADLVSSISIDELGGKPPSYHPIIHLVYNP